MWGPWYAHGLCGTKQSLVSLNRHASRLANFKNVAQSVANRYQRWFCYQMSSSKGELLHSILECGPAEKSSGGPTVLQDESPTVRQAIICVLPNISSLLSTVFIQCGLYGMELNTHLTIVFLFTVLTTDGLDPKFVKLK